MSEPNAAKRRKLLVCLIVVAALAVLTVLWARSTGSDFNVWQEENPSPTYSMERRENGELRWRR